LKPFDLRRDFIEPEDGVATIDWVVLLAALVGLGYAIVDRTSAPLGDHTRDIRGELQDTAFNTYWLDNLTVGGSGEGVASVIPTSDGSNGSGGAATDGTASGQTTSDDTTTSDPNADGTTTDATVADGSASGGGAGDGASGSGSMTNGPVVPASNVQGCPDSSTYIATPIVKTGQELLSDGVSEAATTVGGASENLVNCPGISGLGHFFANPTYTLDLSEMDTYWRLAVAVTSSCNTVLLVQDANGAYVYDDDSGSRDTTTDTGNDLDALVRIFDMASLNGRVNVWVGTADGATCSNTDVTISLR
jgi:hypothetical protein